MGSAEHWVFELFSGAVYWILSSLIIYRWVYKRFMEPRLRRSIHREIDQEHGIDHKDCVGKK